MKKLTLADDLSFPADVITQTLAVLAVRGAGKTNMAAVLAEQMAAANLPFVVLDPVGSWWGLQSIMPIPVFGGRHGNVPLERTGGKLLASLIIDKRLSAVLDLSGFDSEHDKKAFLLDFAKHLYAKNEQPLHLFLEEADDYIPQRPMRDEAYLLRAFENIVRRGRARGLGMTMITQRSASINKNVLTQVETLIVLRTTGPQDINAIAEWVKYHAVDKGMLESLAGLANGEAWIWSPHFLDHFGRHKIHKRKSFDSGATPKTQAAVKMPDLMDIDLEDVREKMAATIEKAKQEDPRELRRELAKLQGELANIRKDVKAPAPPKPVPMIKPAELKRLEQITNKVFVLRDRLDTYYRTLAHTADELAKAVVHASAGDPTATRTAIKLPPIVPPAPKPKQDTLNIEKVKPLDGGAELGFSHRRILETVHMLGYRGMIPTRESVARWLNLHPNGGRYNRNLAELRAQGYLEGMQLTGSGQTKLKDMGSPEVPNTGPDALLSALKETGARRIVETLVNLHPQSVSREELADHLGLHPNGGRFNRNLAWLRDMAVIPDRGPIQLTPGALT